MARQGRGQGPQQPMKGFRPGKEPPQLRKQQAKRQFGKVEPGQERLIEMFAGRSADASRRMLRRWRLGLLAGAILLAVLGTALYGWSVIAAFILYVLGGVVLFLWWRLHRQRQALEAMAEVVSGPAHGRRKRR